MFFENSCTAHDDADDDDEEEDDEEKYDDDDDDDDGDEHECETKQLFMAGWNESTASTGVIWLTGSLRRGWLEISRFPYESLTYHFLE